MNLQKAKELALALIAEQHLANWRFEFDRSLRRFGCCKFRTQRITLSSRLTELNEESQVRDTILHEIAHALAGVSHGHDEHWRTIAQGIGCTGTRCYDASEVKQPTRKYTGTCPTCKREIHRHRRMRISCGKCSKDFDATHLFTWKITE